MRDQQERLISTTRIRMISTCREALSNIMFISKLFFIMGVFMLLEGLILQESASDDTMTTLFSIGSLFVAFGLCVICHKLIKDICRRLNTRLDHMQSNIELSTNQELRVPSNNYNNSASAENEIKNDDNSIDAKHEKTQMSIENDNIPSYWS